MCIRFVDILRMSIRGHPPTSWCKFLLCMSILLWTDMFATPLPSRVQKKKKTSGQRVERHGGGTTSSACGAEIGELTESQRAAFGEH